MMICDACGKRFEGDACEICAVEVEPFEWMGLDDFGEDSTAEAMILGELATLLDDPTLLAGAMPQEGGKLQPVVYYGTRAASQMIDVDLFAAPTARGVYEDAIVGKIDGSRTVREISSSSKLPPQEMITAIVALIERGILCLHGAATFPEYDVVLDGATSPDLHLDILEPVLASDPAPAPRARGPSRVPAPRASSSSRNNKAAVLYAQALEDRAAGNLGSALTNVKLAIVFDRNNVECAELFAELSTEMGRLTKGESASARVAALFEQATRAEALNEIDRAIQLLEDAILIQKDPRCLNRLGIILVMRKKRIARGRELIAKALELDPQNVTYKHNLKKFSEVATVPMAKPQRTTSAIRSFFSRREVKS